MIREIFKLRGVFRNRGIAQKKGLEKAIKKGFNKSKESVKKNKNGAKNNKKNLRQQKQEKRNILLQKQKRRALLAVCLILVGLVVVVKSDFLLRQLSASQKVVTAFAGDTQQNTSCTDKSQLPAWFYEEVLTGKDLSAVTIKNIQTMQKTCLIGFECRDSSEQAFTRLQHALEEKDWLKFDAGLATSASFRKSSGTCSWLWLSCVEVSGATSGVVQCVYSD